MTREIWLRKLRENAPGVHCLTNPVTMQDVANVLLAAGGSAVMGREPSEVRTLTALSQATLLNTGVPDEAKLRAWVLAGRKANELGRPVVLDPAGVGASLFRRNAVALVRREVKLSLIRCNQEEACALLEEKSGPSGGVESSVELEQTAQMELADRLAGACGCAVLISGETDAVSDGERRTFLTGGDARIRRISGGGCMLSALCALFAGAGLAPYEAACAAGSIWKESARLAGARTDRAGGGIGSFHIALFDALEELCGSRDESCAGTKEKEQE